MITDVLKFSSSVHTLFLVKFLRHFVPLSREQIHVMLSAAIRPSNTTRELGRRSLGALNPTTLIKDGKRRKKELWNRNGLLVPSCPLPSLTCYNKLLIKKMMKKQMNFMSQKTSSLMKTGIKKQRIIKKTNSVTSVYDSPILCF